MVFNELLVERQDVLVLLLQEGRISTVLEDLGGPQGLITRYIKTDTSAYLPLSSRERDL